MSLDDCIWEAVAHSTPKQPRSLSDIIDYIDSREKVIATFEELQGSLQRLVEAGRVVQAKDEFYAGPSGAGQPGVFHPLSSEMYQQAVKDYRKRFSGEYRKT